MMIWLRAAQSEAAPKPLALVFVDVSGSIDQKEFEAHLKRVPAVINQLPPDSDVQVYPIRADMELPERLFHVEGLGKQVEGKQANELLTALRVAYGTRGKGEPQSCILGALAYAASRVKEQLGMERSQRATLIHVVIMSDMIEDCSESPLGRGIVLAKKELMVKELHQADYFEKNSEYQFGRAYITVILAPRLASPVTGGQRPRVEELKQFWGKFFTLAATVQNGVRWFPETIPTFAKGVK